MGVRQKLPLIGSKRRIVRWFGYVVYIFVALIVLGILFGGGNKTQTATPTATENVECIDLKFYDFWSMFSPYSKYTSLQKKEKFKEYKGKCVKWSGQVDSVSEKGDKMIVRFTSVAASSTVVVKLLPDQKEKLTSYSKGDKITFEAILDSYWERTDYGTWKLPILINGKIVE